MVCKMKLHHPVAYTCHCYLATLRVVDDEVLVRMVAVGPTRECLLQQKQLALKAPIKHL